MFTYATLTFITEALHLLTQVQLLLIDYSELMPYTALAHSYWASSMMCINAKATLINDTDYNCDITAVELV